MSAAFPRELSLWNLFDRQTVLLRSRLPLESCRARLRAQTSPWWDPIAAFRLPVRGWIGADGFSILRNVQLANAFQTQARARWNSEVAGTRIEVTFAMRWWVAAVWIAVLAIIVASAATGWVTGLPHRPPGSGPLWLLEIRPIFVIGLVVFVITFGRWLARNESRELIAFLSETLQCSSDAAAREPTA